MLVESESERRGGRLIDDAEHVEAGNLAGVLRCLHAPETNSYTSYRIIHSTVLYSGGNQALPVKTLQFCKGFELALNTVQCT